MRSWTLKKPGESDTDETLYIGIEIIEPTGIV